MLSKQNLEFSITNLASIIQLIYKMSITREEKRA